MRPVYPPPVRRAWLRELAGNTSGLGARQAHSIAQTVRNISVSALTENLADELGPAGVNVTVDAREVTFLASPRSIAISGDAVAVGSGVPGPVYY